MKFFNQFTGFSALLLAGTMGFAACSSDDEVADVNPSYDGSSVKAQFSINIPANMGKSGRMSAGQAQQNDEAFLGMRKINLFPLVMSNTINDDNVAAQKISTAPKLGDIAASTSGTSDWNNASIHAKVYKDVQFDLGTNYALFYAEGKHADTENCGLTPDYALTGSTISSINFSLDAPYEANAAVQAYLLTVLNGIAGELATQGATYAGVKTLEETFKAKVNGDYKIIAGSSKNILAMAANLYASCKRGVIEDATAADGYTAVMNKVKDYFTVSAEDVVDGFKTDATGYKTGADNFPFVCNVPDGSVAVQFVEASNGFISATYNMGSAYSNWSITEPATYRKPSSLYYFVQTPVKTRDTEWLNDNLSGKNNWNDVVSQYSGTKVTASTRSMILEKPVQYGVAALATDVVASSLTLQDEKGDVKDITDKLTITGIIIGGQKNVDWKFQPAAASEEYVVYDKNFCYDEHGAATNPKLSTTSLAKKNYTLLLESQSNTAVNVAIEFENNIGDFYGKDHILIAKGTKFYLLAKLNPEASTGVTDNPNKSTVFLQDYLTTAKFTVTSLKNAYNIIPDLRSPKLEFGLSVDLDWQTGMDFEVTVE